MSKYIFKINFKQNTYSCMRSNKLDLVSATFILLPTVYFDNSITTLHIANMDS